MRYHQLTSEERYALGHMRQSHYSQAEIARVLGRHPSTISRELRRNRREDGFHRAFTADEKTQRSTELPTRIGGHELATARAVTGEPASRSAAAALRPRQRTPSPSSAVHEPAS